MISNSSSVSDSVVLIVVRSVVSCFMLFTLVSVQCF